VGDSTCDAGASVRHYLCRLHRYAAQGCASAARAWMHRSGRGLSRPTTRDSGFSCFAAAAAARPMPSLRSVGTSVAHRVISYKPAVALTCRSPPCGRQYSRRWCKRPALPLSTPPLRGLSRPTTRDSGFSCFAAAAAARPMPSLRSVGTSVAHRVSSYKQAVALTCRSPPCGRQYSRRWCKRPALPLSAPPLRRTRMCKCRACMDAQERPRLEPTYDSGLGIQLLRSSGRCAAYAFATLGRDIGRSQGDLLQTSGSAHL
jgi:hypothetical protein